MTVKELKEILDNMDDDRVVIVSGDPEGNSYMKLRVVDDNYLYSEYHGEICSEQEYIENYETPVVLLFP